MNVNYTNQTETSKVIIKNLLENGVILKVADKQLIIDKVYEAIIISSKWKSNGCDCGQMWCPICN